MSDAARAAEHAARVSYGRLLALLAARDRDIARAEDALAEAFASALTVWPRKGVPENPDAWLLTTARNRLTDQHRRATRFRTQDLSDDLPLTVHEVDALPDRRLALMMVCAHPAIAPDMHIPLMLQTVLGMQASDIAKLFAISPSALSKRLVRAKQKIRDARIAFDLPAPAVLPERLGAICEAIYALHAHDWLAPSADMGEEALYLADLLTRLMPDTPEPMGLAALIAFSHARRDARLSNGVLLPIDEQDPALWDDALSAYALGQLKSAQSIRQPGRFQTEAVIQSVHMARKITGQTDWQALDRLYQALNTMSPSIGGLVAHAVIAANLNGPEIGLKRLDEIEAGLEFPFQPLHAAKAELLFRANDNRAGAAYERAISLTTNSAEKRFLEARQSRLTF